MRSGDVVAVDFGVPQASEPGFRRPAIVITADSVLAGRPMVVHVVPITGNTARNLPTEVGVSAEGLSRLSAAQCHLCTVVSTSRLDHDSLGNVGPAELAQVRSVLRDLLDIP